MNIIPPHLSLNNYYNRVWMNLQKRINETLGNLYIPSSSFLYSGHFTDEYIHEVMREFTIKLIQQYPQYKFYLEYSYRRPKGWVILIDKN